MAFTVGAFYATAEMRKLVNQVLDSGRLSYGPLSRDFETRFAEMHSCSYGVLSNSGTSSLHVALQAMKELYHWQDGDEVIVPALTFVATINVVYHCRLTPVLVDVEPDYYAIDASQIEAAITQRTRCIIPVHPFGQPADLGAISLIAEKYNLRVIEDSCEAMFVRHGSDYVGSAGDVGCFSTYVAHIITGGVGGIGITNEIDLALRMRSLVNHGIDTSGLPTGTRYDPTFLSREFRFTSVGHSFRVTELEAALLLPQLAEATDIIKARQRNALRISSILQEWEDKELLQLPKTRPHAEHAYMVYPIVMLQARKFAIMAYLRSRGIECRDMLPLTNQPCYDFVQSKYPVAHRINQTGFYIGCHQYLTNDDFSHLNEMIRQWYSVPAEIQ